MAASEASVSDRRVLAHVFLKPRRAQPFYHRHPWVFEGAIERIEGPQEVGTEAILHTERGEPVARGLLNPHSKIRVRLFEWPGDKPLDLDFFAKKIDAALALRSRFLGETGTRAARRLICSEGDGLSGLTVDQFAGWLVVQLTSAALATRWEALQELLQQRLSPRGIFLRTEKGIGEAEGLEIDEELVTGVLPPTPLVIEELGIEYEVDLLGGQKTGFFLDQRDNRQAAAGYVSRAIGGGAGRVLDLFCYSGGFGITALKRGAAHVLAVDASASAIELATRNAIRNGVGGQIEFRTDTAFDTLERLVAQRERFDGVVLDPPKMTRTRGTLEKALKGYFALNRLAVDLLPPGGILVTCSCSGLVSRDDFEQMLSNVGMRSGRDIQILEARGPAADHPIAVSCPESNYLKCYICRVV